VAEFRIRHAAAFRQLLDNAFGHPMNSPNMGHVFLLRLLDAAHVTVGNPHESIALVGEDHRDETRVPPLNHLDV